MPETESKNAFQLAKEKLAGGGGTTSEPGTALTVTPAEREVEVALQKKYNITPALEDAAIQQWVVSHDLQTLTPPMRAAFMLYEAKRLGVGIMCIEIMDGEGGKKKPYYNNECAKQMRNNREGQTKIVERGFLEINDCLFAKAISVTYSADGSRSEESIGLVEITGKKGKQLGDLIMKVDSVAKRRSTLDLYGVSSAEPKDGSSSQKVDAFLGLKVEENNEESLEDVFADSGESLLGTAQPEETAIATAEAETEPAEDADVVGESASSEALPTKGKQESPGARKSEKAKATTAPSSNTSSNPSSVEGEAQVSEEKGESAPGSSTEDTTSQSQGSEPSSSTESESGAQTSPDDEDLDAIFASLEDDEFLETDPEDLEPAGPEKLQEIFDVAKKCGFEKPEIAKQIAKHLGVKVPQVPETLKLSHHRRALLWFTTHNVGEDFEPDWREPPVEAALPNE